MIFFLDASALAKRYVLEPGSDRIRALFRRRAQIAISRLSEVEVVSALVRRCSMRRKLELSPNYPRDCSISGRSAESWTFRDAGAERRP